MNNNDVILIKKLQNGLELFACSLYNVTSTKKNFFVTEQHDKLMKKIVKLDEDKVLEQLVIRFVSECKSSYREIKKQNSILKLQDAFKDFDDKIETDYIAKMSINNGKQQFKPKFVEKKPLSSAWVTPEFTSTEEATKEYQHHLYSGNNNKLSFLMVYEISRILKPFGPIKPTFSIWEYIKTNCGGSNGFKLNEYFRVICQQYCKSQNINPFLEISRLLPRNQNVWKLWEDEQIDISTTKSSSSSPSHILYSAKVVPCKGKLVIHLNPPKIGVSKRYYRLYSSNRFLHIKVETDNFDGELQSQLLCPLNLFERRYEFFYAKDKIFYYFATHGIDLEPKSLWEVIDFNIPMELNHDLTISKFYSRVSLGLSNTKPTIVFQPHEIRYNVDDIIKNGHCMTDGCSAISLAAMKKVALMLGYLETPPAIQGRIGGSKGVWYLKPQEGHDNDNGVWIELRESQIKYQLRPHRVGNDEHLRTLEVINVVKSPKTPGLLNIQFIRVLENGGLSANVFIQIVKENISRIKEKVIGNENRHELISWLHDVGNITKRRINEKYMYNDDDISPEITNQEDFTNFETELKELSGVPESNYEQCIQLLSAGFTPSSCAFLAKKLTDVLIYTLSPLINKYKIEVPLSRTLICIADPSGTLQPGEIFIQLDKYAGIDPRTGLPFGVIEGYVILARNPCLLPSDIIKVKAVKNQYLKNYYNLVIFPINVKPGEGSLANHLSGGDYDGDKIFCCWDPRIVTPFQNSLLLPLDPNVKEAFEKNNIRLQDVLSRYKQPSTRARKLQEVILYIYLSDPPLGLYDWFHRLHSNKYGLSNPRSIYFAQMCAQLVDATKQGLKIKQDVLKIDKESVFQLPIPKWMGKGDLIKNEKKRNLNVEKREGDEKMREGEQEENNDKMLNEIKKSVMDILYISVENEKKVLGNESFTVANNQSETLDSHIRLFWLHEMELANKIEDDGAYKSDLLLIGNFTHKLVQDYNTRYYDKIKKKNEAEMMAKTSSTTTSIETTPERKKSTSSIKNKTTSKLFNDKRVEKDHSIEYEFLHKFMMNPPVVQYKSNRLKYISRVNFWDPHVLFELQLKSSALYMNSFLKKDTGQCCWMLAFRTLCNIKAMMMEFEQSSVLGGPRFIIDEVWNTLKVDKKWLEKEHNNTEYYDGNYDNNSANSGSSVGIINDNINNISNIAGDSIS
ncbi:1086_t:CDS:2, partial [Entrophospora sp. SA101]